MNDELTLSGVKYISAKRAAEITQYSRDYIGQLCREGKILASRVGRNWYVAEKSILRHKTENGTDLSACEPAQAEIPLASKIRQDKGTRLIDSINSISKEEEGHHHYASLSPPRPKESIYQEPAHQSAGASRRLAGGSLATYYPDDRPVLPQLQREETKVVKESTQAESGNKVPIKISNSRTKHLPAKYVDTCLRAKHRQEKPVRSKAVYLEVAMVASLFFVVSFGLFMSNSDYGEVAWTGMSEISGASALEAFNQTAALVSRTVDGTIYDYLYAPLLDN